METQYSTRINRLKKELIKHEMRGVILVPGANLRYYTGGNSMLLERPFFLAIPVDGDPQLLTPTLEAGPYFRSPVKIAVHSWMDSDGPANAMRETVQGADLTGRWGMEGSMPYRFLYQLQHLAQPQVEDADPILQGIRAVKDALEIKALARAAAILSKSFRRIPNMLKPGISEVELSQTIAREVHSNGAESVPDVLVQTGPNAADGHHLPSSRKLRKSESIVVDATCTYAGYYADITRTFILGKNKAFEQLYDKLLRAQEAAVRAARTGVEVGVVDDAARASLHKQKLDGYFNHRTGHGLGLEVHEAPYIVPNGKAILQSSMAFTVEPGVYMPGKTGLRIEDDLIAEKGLCKVLTKSVPKEYDWWN